MVTALLKWWIMIWWRQEFASTMLRNMIKLLSFCFLSRLAPMTMLNWISTSMENTCIVLWQEWREQFTQFFMVGRIPIWGWLNLSISCISSGLHPHVKSMVKCTSGSSRPFDKGGPSLQKKIFWPFRPQFGLKIRWDMGGRAPQAPPLDPPLIARKGL